MYFPHTPLQIKQITAVTSQCGGVRVSGRGVHLTSDLHVVPRLRKNGVIPPFPVYALLAWTTLPFKKGGGGTCFMVRDAVVVNPLKPELNPICHFLALLAHHFLHVSRIRVISLTIRLLMSYIYGAPILDVSRSHTTTQHSR